MVIHRCFLRKWTQSNSFKQCCTDRQPARKNDFEYCAYSCGQQKQLKSWQGHVASFFLFRLKITLFSFGDAPSRLQKRCLDCQQRRCLDCCSNQRKHTIRSAVTCCMTCAVFGSWRCCYLLWIATPKASQGFAIPYFHNSILDISF